MATFGTLQTQYNDGDKTYAAIVRKCNLEKLYDFFDSLIRGTHRDKRNNVLSIVTENGHDLIVRTCDIDTELFDPKTWIKDGNCYHVNVHFDFNDFDWFDIKAFFDSVGKMLNIEKTAKPKPIELPREMPIFEESFDLSMEAFLASRFGGAIKAMTHSNRHSKRNKR